jgi:hypothetical protein
MISHSLSVKLLEYGIFILSLAQLKKIPNGFYIVVWSTVNPLSLIISSMWR